jgi:hypothetical protein
LHKGSYVGGSGGISSFYSIPSWQANVSMAANGGSTANRNVPDVALAADNIYVQYGDGSSGTFGGTSCAAPLWAGLAALMNEQSLMAGRPAIGFVNPVIYTIGLGTGYHEGFHDITTGNNTSPNSPDGFYAVTGYDLCTGWGTPAGQSLINAIAGPPDSLGISPATGFAVTGTVGGSFDATSTTFLLTNSGATSLAWNLINTSAWLKVSSNGGILAVDSSTSVTASLNVAASNLAAGNYTAGLKFTTQNSHVVQDIPFSLNIVQSLVQNGGFETGDFTGWTLAGNTTVFTPFGTTVYNAVENLTNYPMVVHSGNFGAFLGDVQLATLSQALATIPGEQYLLSFWLDDPTNGGLQQFQVDWNGSNIYSITDPPAFLWTNLQFIVTAANLDTLLQFGAENDLAYFGLDDVRLTYIPSIVFKAVLQTPGSFDLTWSAAAGLVYQVQYKTNLLQSNWLNLTKPLVATTNTLTVSDTGSSPRRFYRVIAAP